MFSGVTAHGQHGSLLDGVGGWIVILLKGRKRAVGFF